MERDFMKKEIKKYLLEFKNGTSTMFKEFFNKETNKKQRANMWTFSRLIIPFLTLICSIIAIITNILPLFVVSSVLAGLGGITDRLDGLSARKHESFSEYGKLLDQVTDKVFAGIISLNLLILNLNYLGILLGEGLIAAINIYYKKKFKIDIKSTIVGKAKQIPLFASLTLGFLSPINSVLMIIANISIIITFISQLLTTTSYIKQNNNEIKNVKNKNDMILNETNNKSEEKKKLKEITKHNNCNNKVNELQTPNKLEQYKKLRDVLNQIIIKYNESGYESEDKGNQKLFQIKK